MNKCPLLNIRDRAQVFSRGMLIQISACNNVCLESYTDKSQFEGMKQSKVANRGLILT